MRDAESEDAQGKVHRRAGEFLERLCATGYPGTQDGKVLTGWTVRMPTEEEPMTLLVLRALGEEGRVVSFIGGPTVLATLLAWRAREGAGKMKWRQDMPWGER